MTVDAIRRLVRETGYNLFMLSLGTKDEAYSRAKYIHDLSCNILRECDEEAEDFIRDTWRGKEEK